MPQLPARFASKPIHGQRATVCPATIHLPSIGMETGDDPPAGPAPAVFSGLEGE